MPGTGALPHRDGGDAQADDPIKGRYDPDKIFRINQNIRPAR